jgi:hypothetical protein
MLAPSRGCVLAAFEHIKSSGAQFLMIAGDLSNDGELCSHEEMRELLYEFKKTMPVYVITATHDWCCDGNPRRYVGDEILHDVETIPPEKLHEFYKDFKNDKNVIIHAHPFRNNMCPTPLGSVDGIETFNNHPAHNSRIGLATRFAKEAELLVSGGSDFHDPDRAGLCITRTKYKLEDSYHIAEAIKSRDIIFDMSGHIVIPYIY